VSVPLPIQEGGSRDHIFQRNLGRGLLRRRLLSLHRALALLHPCLKCRGSKGDEGERKFAEEMLVYRTFLRPPYSGLGLTVAYQSETRLDCKR
jgi:hypothetical protein